MNHKTLIRRLKQLKTRDDACQLAADLGDVLPKTFGSCEERFIKGWLAAIDAHNQGDIRVQTDAGFLHLCLYFVRAGGYDD